MNVLEISKREINNKTDISFEYQPIKAGRKVVSIRFVITRNRQAAETEEATILPAITPPTEPEPLAPRLTELASALVAHGVTEGAALACVREHPAEIIAGTLTELDRRSKRGEKIETKAGWLLDAIRNGWFTENIQEQARRDREREDGIRREERRKSLDAFIYRIKTEYRDYTKKAIAQYIEMLDETERKNLETNFRQDLETHPDARFMDTNLNSVSAWYSDPLIRIKALKYLPEHCPDFLFLSLDEFAKQQGIENLPKLE